MSKEVLSQFTAYIQQNYSGILSISPVNSTTPFEVQNMITGKSEFLFLSKCSPDLYEPVKGRDISAPTNIQFKMYNEGDNLIVAFELLGMILESEIPASGAKAFLSILFQQEKITFAIVDANTYQVIWLTNTIPFRTIRFHYKEVFEKYGVF